MTTLTLTIRKATEADFPAIASIISEVTPQHPTSAESLAHEIKVLTENELNPYVRYWLAEQGGLAVGFAAALQFVGMFHPDRYWAELMVRPEARRQGIGTRLAQVLREDLTARHAREVQAGAYQDDPASLHFLTHHGLTEHMRFFDNVLELGAVNFDDWQAQMQMPQGVRALSFADLVREKGQDEATRMFYEAFSEARLDVPRSGEATEMPRETFDKRLEDPHYYPEGVWLAVTDAGEVVALSELWKAEDNPGRLDIGLTGTRRAWRRKGLALALKLAGMRVAQEAGVKELWTGNATTNLPMLTLNQRLGFQPRPAFIQCKWGSV